MKDKRSCLASENKRFYLYFTFYCRFASIIAFVYCIKLVLKLLLIFLSYKSILGPLHERSLLMNLEIMNSEEL